MKHPHEFTPFYKMPSFWLMVVLPVIVAIVWLATNPHLLLA